MAKEEIVSPEAIEQKIFLIRGIKVRITIKVA
jgi:hypothetical protein